MNKAEKMYEKIATSFLHKNVDLEIELDAKNKEIEDLKNRVDELECQLAYECGCNEQLCELQNKLEKVSDDIRRQVCEDIKDICVYKLGTKEISPTSISTYALNYILDEIKNGETALLMKMFVKE